MKRLAAVLIAASLLASNVDATAMLYPPTPEPQATSSSSKSSNVVPIVSIVGAVATVGYVIFKVRKTKQARAARFNIYVAQK